MGMLELRGAPALSPFRQNKVLNKLQQALPHVTGVYAEFMHFADLSAELTESERLVLERILRYGPKAEVKEPAAEMQLVVPRFGTISPWSSKATDIAHNCGLSSILRLERGIAYYIEGAKSEDRDIIASLLHDRMTETVLSSSAAAEALFSHAEPAPLTTVDILAGGRKQKNARERL